MAKLLHSIIKLVLIYSKTILCPQKCKVISLPDLADVDEITSAECLQFDFETIERATEEFSESKKLGEGGFGEVYQVTMKTILTRIKEGLCMINISH